MTDDGDTKTVHVPKLVAQKLRAELKIRNLPVRGGMTVAIEKAIRNRLEILKTTKPLTDEVLEVPSEFNPKGGYNVYVLDEELSVEFKSFVLDLYGSERMAALSYEITEAVKQYINKLEVNY